MCMTFPGKLLTAVANGPGQGSLGGLPIYESMGRVKDREMRVCPGSF